MDHPRIMHRLSNLILKAHIYLQNVAISERCHLARIPHPFTFGVQGILSKYFSSKLPAEDFVTTENGWLLHCSRTLWLCLSREIINQGDPLPMEMEIYINSIRIHNSTYQPSSHPLQREFCHRATERKAQLPYY